jgi:hypothetical protein
MRRPRYHEGFGRNQMAFNLTALSAQSAGLRISGPGFAQNNDLCELWGPGNHPPFSGGGRRLGKDRSDRRTRLDHDPQEEL